METDRIKIRTAVMSVMAVIVLEAGGAKILNSYPDLPVLGLVMGIRLLEIASLLLIVIRFENGLSAVGLAGSQLPGGFIRGVRWSLVFGVVAFAGFLLFMAVGLDPFHLLHVPLPGTFGARVLFFITGGLIGPVGEELFFRGILYGFLRQWGMLPALIITTLLFALMHPPGAFIPIPQIIGSIVFTLAYEQKDELVAPVTIHCLGNLSLFILSLL
ncbi:MAG: type II CAAX endopeptidase family protein [Desulfobacterium sp.]